MDFSLLSSTSSSNCSNVSNNKHITIARKLHDISRRIKYAKRIIKEEGALKYGGCTNERVGPPAFLGEPYNSEWKKDIRNCANKCVWHYLLPAYLQKTEYYKNKVQTDIVEKITEENREIIERGIKLGRDRANRKWDKKEGIIKTVSDSRNIGGFREEEIGLLKRGESQLIEGEVLEESHNIKQTVDIFKIISHAIYGSGRFKNLVSRNLWKFIQLNEVSERDKFTPFVGKLSNNTEKVIHTWSMFCAFLKNRDLPITTYELDIISSLYDVKIKIFRKTQIGYNCTWSSKYNICREVNLLNTSNNEWLVLIKKKCSNGPKMFSYLEDLDQAERNKEVCNEAGSNSNLLNIIQPCYRTYEDTSTLFNKASEDKDLEIVQEESSVQNNIYVESQNSSDLIGEERVTEKVLNVRNNRKRLLWQKWRKKVRDSKRNRERKREEILKKEGSKMKRRQLVFDFTKEGLGIDEIELLSKGESFCVANHKVDEDRLKTDIFNFSRRLRLHEEFREPKVGSQDMNNRFSVITQTQVENRSNVVRTSNSFTPITQTPPDSSSTNNIAQQTISQRTMHRDSFYNEKDKIRKPASLYDPDSQNRNLNRYIQCIQEESMLIIKKKGAFKDNITVEQRKAMKSLIDKIEKKIIIITKADKGSGLVTVDYDLYIQKGTKYIEEEAKAYIKINDSAKNIIHKLTKARNSVVQKLKENDVIEIETATYCNKQLEEKITGLKFYYKIHKDSNIHTMPLRPLQSCINAPTHHLSQVLTDILQPFLKDKYIPTYLQDSNQLLYRLDKLQALSLEDTII